MTYLIILRLQSHVRLDNYWIKQKAVKTVLQTIIVLRGTQLLHALPVIDKKKWALDWENKKVIAH